MSSSGFPLPEHLRHAVKTRIAERYAVDHGDPEPDEDLFGDFDAERGRGRGAYVFDEAEAASRRVDLTGCGDPDPGPIALEEAPPGLDATVLEFM